MKYKGIIWKKQRIKQEQTTLEIHYKNKVKYIIKI